MGWWDGRQARALSQSTATNKPCDVALSALTGALDSLGQILSFTSSCLLDPPDGHGRRATERAIASLHAVFIPEDRLQAGNAAGIIMGATGGTVASLWRFAQAPALAKQPVRLDIVTRNIRSLSPSDATLSYSGQKIRH